MDKHQEQLEYEADREERYHLILSQLGKLTDAGEFRTCAKFEAIFTKTGRLVDEGLEERVCDTGGPLDPLVVWREFGVLLDGHRRYAICKKHNLPFEVRYVSFETLEDAQQWVEEEQGTRRNLTDHELSLFIHKMRERTRGTPSAKFLIAEATGQSERNVRRLDRVGKAIKNLTPDWQDYILGNDHRGQRLTNDTIVALAALPLHEQEELLVETLRFGKEAIGTKFGLKSPAKADDTRHESVLNKSFVESAERAVAAQAKETRYGSRINSLLKVAISEVQLAGNASDQIFTGRGLGKNSVQSGWKRRIDEAYRDWMLVLREIKESAAKKPKDRLR